MNPEFGADGSGFRVFERSEPVNRLPPPCWTGPLVEAGKSYLPVPLVVGRRLSLATFSGHTSVFFHRRRPKSIPSTRKINKNGMQIACRIVYLFPLYNYRPVFISKIYDRIFRFALDDFHFETLDL